MELGWTIFSSNLWYAISCFATQGLSSRIFLKYRNGLDFIFVLMFVIYLPLRIIGLRADQETAAREALSILSKHATYLARPHSLKYAIIL